MSAHHRINLSSLRRRSSSSNNSTSDTNSNVKGAKKKKEVLQSCSTDSPTYQLTEAEEKSLSQNTKQVINTERMQNKTPLSNVVSITTASGDSCISGPDCFKDNFYDVPCEQLARSLLGKILVRRLDTGHILKGRVVETECYLGGEDQASHSYHCKMTERNAPMFMKPGTTYVYLTYGMYHCINISSQGPGAAVLIRALEPLEGLDVMAELRARGPKAKKKKEEGKQRKKPPLQPHELCNGPAKLCMAMDIDRDSCTKRDLTTWPGLSVADDVGASKEAKEALVVVTKRVGIESVGREWADKPLRFYLLGNTSVSKRDRAREKELLATA